MAPPVTILNDMPTAPTSTSLDQPEAIVNHYQWNEGQSYSNGPELWAIAKVLHLGFHGICEHLGELTAEIRALRSEVRDVR